MVTSPSTNWARRRATCYGTVCRHLHLAEPTVGAQVQLLTQSGVWHHGVIDVARGRVKVMEDNQLKVLRNVVRISHAGHALTDRQLKLILCICGILCYCF